MSDLNEIAVERMATFLEETEMAFSGTEVQAQYNGQCGPIWRDWMARAVLRAIEKHGAEAILSGTADLGKGETQ